MNSLLTKILVVDDELVLQSVYRDLLEKAGYQVFTASDGWEALDIFSQQQPALSIVDLRMPGMDGFELIRHIRDVSDSYILVLSALGAEKDVVRALELGADEYLVKPIKVQEFRARVASLIRRAEPSGAAALNYSDGFLSLNILTNEALINGDPLYLRPTEFRLLTFLAFNRDRVVRHRELLDRVWNDADGSMDSLKWYISSIRSKIRKVSPGAGVVSTVPRVGYRYRPPEDGE